MAVKNGICLTCASGVTLVNSLRRPAMLTPPTGPELPVQPKSAISRLRERWRIRRERIKRLNAARYGNHPGFGVEPIVHAHHRQDKGGSAKQD
jgi:hypothetical protein